MKTTFNGIEIKIPQQIKPAVNQVWRNKEGLKVKIYDIVGVQASIETEDGIRAMIGFGWFDGVNYVYLGDL